MDWNIIPEYIGWYMLTLIHGISSIDLLSLNCEVFDEPHLEPSLCKINTESPIYNPTFNQVNIGVEERGGWTVFWRKVVGLGVKWMVFRGKMDVSSRSGQSWGWDLSETVIYDDDKKLIV